MAGPYDHLIGELWPGAFGWLPLDGNPGEPIGPARLEPPNAKADRFACYVMANAKIPLEGQDALVSPTGAPLQGPLNSNVDKRNQVEQQSAPPPEGWSLGGPQYDRTDVPDEFRSKK